MLSTIKRDANAVFFTAIENVEDVSHQILVDGQVSQYYEEDKNYDTSGNFTIFSPAVLNTLVSFFDIYITYGSSEKVLLGFYTTRTFGKERKTTYKDGSSLLLPKEPILQLLTNIDSISDDILQIVKAIVIDEYTSQYPVGGKQGYLEALKSQTIVEFREFFKRITWYFGQEDEKDLKETVLKDIQSSPLHNNAHMGKENIIFCLLMEKLAQGQNRKDLIDKLIHSSDVKLIFKEAESSIADEKTDPTWQYIAGLEAEVSDRRNLKEKIQSAIQDFPERRLLSLARKAGASKYEEGEADKTFLALKYRILAACDEYLSSENYNPPKDGANLDNILRGLLAKSALDIAALKQDYTYSVSNEKTIEGIIWNLFDSCFLAFDEAKNG
jgi:hypothetical protein